MIREILVLLTTVTLVAGCGGGTDRQEERPNTAGQAETAPRPSVESTSQERVRGVEGSSSVNGTVTYAGAVPKLRPVAMDADPGCAKKHDSPAASETLVLGNDRGLANVFINVKGGLGNVAFEALREPVLLDQQGCRYVPHVLGVMAGQPLKILNSDGLLHNVHALPEINRGFNQAMPGSVTETVTVFDKPEPFFKIKCDVHPWMGAYVAVVEHPFFDVTGADGTFRVERLPAGTYEFEAWHEKLGTLSASVTVADGESQRLDFEFSR